MKTNRGEAAKFFPIIILCGTTSTLWAGGFRLPDQDAFATARGEAFVATADNPSAIYYNPAGITQLDDSNVRVGMYGIYLDPSYRNPVTSRSYEIEDKFDAIPQLFYTYSLKDKDWPISFGLGIYSPYGLSEKWPQDTGFRTVATEGSLTYFTINPVIAYKLPWNLSIAEGLMVNYAKIDLQQAVYDPNPDADLFRFKGDGWDVGYNLGVLWQPQEKISLGATFRSGATMKFNGQTETTAPLLGYPSPHSSPANADWPFPLEAAFGISYRPTPKWNLEFDADYTDWSTLGTVNLNQTAPPFFMSSPSPITLDWESSWFFEWGVTRYFDSGWHVSAGYIFNENSVPDAHYTPLVTDMDKHFFSVGTGFKGKQFDFDVAYQFGYGPPRTVAGSAPSSAGQTADGNYNFFSQAIAVSVGWHF
jgi:long-chain fatty acid transport protein